MFKPRRIHRSEAQKDRLYDALRKLYADGVRVCAGRPAAAVAPELPRTDPTARPKRAHRSSILEIDGAPGDGDPYNHSAR